MVNSIEFAAWDIRRFKNDYEHNLLCRYYALIDKSGDCQIVVERYFQKSHLEYFKIDKSLTIFKKTIYDIEKASLKLGTKSDFRPDRPSFYNGQNLIMQVQKDNTKKVINFWQGHQESKIYERLYILIDSLYNKNELVKCDDTARIFISRQKFIKNIIKPDSLINGMPQPPPKGFDIKYIPPVVIDTIN